MRKHGHKDQLQTATFMIAIMLIRSPIAVPHPPSIALVSVAVSMSVTARDLRPNGPSRSGMHQAMERQARRRCSLFLRWASSQRSSEQVPTLDWSHSGRPLFLLTPRYLLSSQPSYNL